MSSIRARLVLNWLRVLALAVAPSFGCGGSSGTVDGATPPPDPDLGNGGAIGGMSGSGSLPLPGGGGIGGMGGTIAGTGGTSPPACGQPGLPCCDGNTCGGDGCCVTGICMAAGGACVGLGGGICNAGACGACGGAGLPCCGSNPAAGVCTAPGTSCNAGSCTKCGDLGAPCCSSASGGTGKCNASNAICSSNVCLACGIPGAPCCPGSTCTSPGCCYNNACVAEAAACGATAGTCQAGRCSGCGAASQPCCSGSTCYDGLLCKAGACTPCGGVGQACCPTTGGALACQAGMACTSSGSDGLCARCGTPGDICCAGNACADGCCSAGRCLAASSCAPPDGSVQTDAPLAGTGGRGGTGGAGGASTVVGSGGIVGSGGTIAGTGGIVGSGGTTTQSGGAGGTTPPWTIPAGCGDGVVTPPEQCDDANNVPFDGCSSDCRNEPTCTGSGPCTSKCGDGLVVGEDCDDGNTKDGDGCSSTCKVEPGFTCAQPPLPNPILVPVVYRDFKFHNPADFEAGVTGSSKASTGVVAADLDSEGKPVFSGLTGTAIHITSTTTFATWYRDTAGVNHANPSQLPLWDNGSGAYVNRYGADGAQWPITETALYCGNTGSELLDANGNPIPCTYKYSTPTSPYTDCEILRAKGETQLTCTLNGGYYQGTFLVQYADGNPLFFPVDGDAFTPASQLVAAQVPPLYDKAAMWPYDLDASGNKRLHNFSFTSEIRYWFKYDADKSYRLDITGDDDVWVFINKKLAVDLGGIHTPVEGSVTVDATAATKFGLVAGNVYEVAVFQAERQSTSSTFKLTLSGFNTAPSVCLPN